MAHICVICAKEFTTLHSLRNHERAHNNPGFTCPQCGYKTKRKYHFHRHLETVHGDSLRRNLPLKRRNPDLPTTSKQVKLEDLKQEPMDEPPVKIEPSQEPTVIELTDDEEEQPVLIDNLDNKPEPPLIDLTDDEPVRISVADFDQNLPNPDARQYYNVRIHRDYAHTFGTNFVDLDISFVNTEHLPLPEQIIILRQVLENIVAVLVRKLPPYDKVRFVMMSDAFRAPISHPFALVQDASVDIIFQSIERVLNSAEDFKLDSSVSLHFIHQQMPRPASGRNALGAPDSRTVLNCDVYRKMKHSLISIPNKDNMCVARGLMIGKKLADNSYVQGYNKSAQLTQDAAQLHELCGIPVGPCTIDKIIKFAENDYFEDYMINIFNEDQLYARVYSGDAKEMKINLLLHAGHCSVMKSVHGFFSSSYWCADCNKCYSNQPHSCELGCPMCKRQECPNRDVNYDRKHKWNCQKCETRFWNEVCLKCHTDRDECKNKTRCEKCKLLVHRKSVDSDGNHPNCGLKYCMVCKKHVDPENHEFCFVQPYKSKVTDANVEEDIIDLLGGNAEEEDEAYWENKEKEEEKQEKNKSMVYYYDMETEFSTGIHHATLVVCQKETGELFKFYGDDAVDQFMGWLLNEKVSYKRILVAHNAKAFDSYPIIQYFFKNNMSPDAIFDGQKCIQLRYKPKKLIFRDSCCFLPFKLEDFTKAFALEAAKTHFPYKFNTPENRDYRGALPDLHFYDPDSKSPVGKAELIKWHAAESKRLQENGLEFILKDVLIEYCINDVWLLKEGCQKYREAGKERMGIDPIVEAITGAGAVHLAFRKNYLKEDSLVVVSDHGLQPETHYSAMANAWLAWLMKKEEVIIQCALNGKEKKIGKYRVDGFLETNERLQTYSWAHGQIVFEFNGCLFHGHKCMSKQKRHPFTHESMAQCRFKTMERKRELESKGYVVIEKYECEFKKEMETNTLLKAHVETMGGLKEPLKPRKGFFGGRTNAIQLLYEPNEGETIEYFDFTSLYPYVNMFRQYPVGAPKIIRHDFEDISKYFGICKVTVLPPQGLFMPILPIRSKKGKLVFTLCATCADMEKPGYRCHHTSDERALKEQVYCTPELIRAVENGYKITSIDEVWHWEESSDKLFAGFMCGWTQVKIGNSGFPSGCDSDEKKWAYVEEQNNAYPGMELKVGDVTKNATMRSLAKLNLNQYWGRYGMQINKTQTKIVKTMEEHMKLFCDPNLAIHDAFPVTDTMMLVRYNHMDDSIPVKPNLSLVVALFTTCWARLHLYDEALSKLDPSQILYMDTDSLIWVRKAGYPELATGPLYGQFKDEIADTYGAGAKVTKFFSSGPKSYGYWVEKDGETTKVCKVKGIPFTSRTLEQFDADKMLDAISALDGRVLEVSVPWKIKRNLKTATLYNEPETKRWQLVYNKRAIVPETHTTLPFGYELTNNA